MEIIATIFSWVLCILGWALKYVLMGAILGGANHAWQNHECLESCHRGDDCGHPLATGGGYILWPIVIPAVIAYEFVRSGLLRRVIVFLGLAEDYDDADDERDKLRAQLHCERARAQNLAARLPGQYDRNGNPVDS